MSVAGVLAWAAGACLAGGLAEAVAARRERGSGGGGRGPVARALRTVVARAGRGLGARAPRDLAARLAAAGSNAAPADVMALKGGLALAGALLALPLAAAAPGRLGVAVLIALPAAAYLAPDARLRRRARRRRSAMEAELADVLDLLRVAVGAGLAPRRALAEVGRRHPGVLAAELRRAAGRAALGVPGDAALDGLETRCPADGVSALADALRRAERHGAPLGRALAAQAAEARARRAQLAAELAARAAPKIQLVVALLLVPSVLLLVAAALIPALAGGAL